MRLRGTELVVKLSLLGGALLTGLSNLYAQDVVNQPYTRNVVDRREETVYQEEYVTQMKESQHMVLTPVTEYQWEPRVHNRFNILRPRSMAYHLVPRTRWEARSHTVRTPVTYRQLRPQTRVVEVPRRELGFSQAPAVGGASIVQNSDAGGARVAARHGPLPQYRGGTTAGT